MTLSATEKTELASIINSIRVWDRLSLKALDPFDRKTFDVCDKALNEAVQELKDKFGVEIVG